MADYSPTFLNPEQLLALRGLRFAAPVLRKLKDAGIYCTPAVSIELQQAAKRYLLRGVESGGSVSELGCYCSFINEDGSPLPWFQRMDSVGANGIHGVVLAPTLVRIEMFRVKQTYDLLITRHTLIESGTGARPKLENSILFSSRQGTLEIDLSSKYATLPDFYTRSGEPMTITAKFHRAVAEVVRACNCCGCRHCHVLVAPNK